MVPRLFLFILLSAAVTIVSTMAALSTPSSKPKPVPSKTQERPRTVPFQPTHHKGTEPLPPLPPCAEIPRRDAFRRAISSMITATAAASATQGGLNPPAARAADGVPLDSPLRLNYRYCPDWTGTALTLLSPDAAAAAAAVSIGQFPMGRWPDPILRRPASAVPPRLFGSAELRSVADALRRTARAEGAVGLAAQQCAVDVRLIWLDDVDVDAVPSPGGGGGSMLGRISGLLGGVARTGAVLGEGKAGVGGGGASAPERTDAAARDVGGGIFLANPRIVERSPEVDMRVWTERCLVLPPSFEATVLRDAFVTVEFETLQGSTQRIELGGELARACQHEMDHDRGILITDHVGLDEMVGGVKGVMAQMEGEGHAERMSRAYERTVDNPVIGTYLASASGDHKTPNWFGDWPISPAGAAEMPDPTTSCDDACLAERKRIIEERRAMMRQARSSTSRQDVFELSRQRAALYNTTYQGSSCPPGVPCL